MGLETNVDLTVWCDDYHALEDMLQYVINGNLGMRMSPWLYGIRDSVEEQYFAEKSVERGSENGMYFMKLHGMAHHLSVRDWFVLPIDEMRRAFREGRDVAEACGDSGFFLKLICRHEACRFKIECTSEGREHLDDHEITLVACRASDTGGRAENKIALTIDGVATESGYALDMEKENENA